MYKHLKDRHLNFELHPVWYTDEVATFPMYNLSGQLTGYHIYRPAGSKKFNNNPYEGKYFTRTFNTFACWGLESYSLSNTLFVTEGIFDAARVTSLGYSAVCLFSSALSKPLVNWLYIIRANRPVVALCDGDKGGNLLGKYLSKSYYMPEGHDPASVDETYLKKVLQNA